MGNLMPVYVIGEIGLDSLEAQKIDDFISKSKMKQLFAKCPSMVNGYLTYFMAWDGSKALWDTSLKAEEIRKEFIEILKLAHANIWEIHAGHDHDGDFLLEKSPEPRY